MLASRTPFAEAREEALGERLAQALRQTGAQAEALHMPCTYEPAERLIEEMLVARTVRLRNVDLLVALNFPACLVPHPNKVYWLCGPRDRHSAPVDRGRSKRLRDERSRKITSALQRAQALAFGEARTIYVPSLAVAQQMQRRYRLEAAVLGEPASDEAWASAAERLLG